jgi:hypothetical protein
MLKAFSLSAAVGPLGIIHILFGWCPSSWNCFELCTHHVQLIQSSCSLVNVNFSAACWLVSSVLPLSKWLLHNDWSLSISCIIKYHQQGQWENINQTTTRHCSRDLSFWNIFNLKILFFSLTQNAVRCAENKHFCLFLLATHSSSTRSGDQLPPNSLVLRYKEPDLSTYEHVCAHDLIPYTLAVLWFYSKWNEYSVHSQNHNRAECKNLTLQLMLLKACSTKH